MEIGTKLEGASKTITLLEDGVLMTYSWWVFPFKGDKKIPFSSITAVQFLEAKGLLAGYLQFSIKGAFEVPGSIAEAVFDENSITFDKPFNDQFRELKDEIDARIAKPASALASKADELEKLASLLDRGALTRDEFDAEKAKLLGKE